MAVDTADQTVRAELADATLAHHLDVEPGDPVLAFDRRSRSGGAPLERVTSHYRGDRYELHVSLDSTMPEEARHTTTGGEPMTTADATAEAGAKKRLNLAPLQKFGRSLMLPIAALPVAALMLRLGQPDLLGADGLGWDKVAAVLAGGGGALFANLPLLFAVGVAIGMAKKADGSTALAAVVGYLVFKGVGDAVSPFVLPLPAAG